MGYYTTLIRLRNITSSNSLSTICKAKKYLKPGQKPPADVKVTRGKRGGIYYMTEDVHAARGTTPQKRLPAFRKQEDNSLRHRTKTGEHGPGSYFIREKEGQHHLSFVSPEGQEMQLGSHADIRELKKQVDKFKGKEVSTDELLKRPHYSVTNSNGETTTVIGEYKDQEPEKKVRKKEEAPKLTPVKLQHIQYKDNRTDEVFTVHKDENGEIWEEKTASPRTTSKDRALKHQNEGGIVETYTTILGEQAYKLYQKDPLHKNKIRYSKLYIPEPMGSLSEYKTRFDNNLKEILFKN